MHRITVLLFTLALASCHRAEPSRSPSDSESPEESAPEEAASDEVDRTPNPPEPALSPEQRDQRGDQHLKAGRFDAAVAEFDACLEARPELAPYHWRRGIALYYAGRYADGAAQFDSHRGVNPADVENAAWHYLCVARLDDPAAARAALLPVQPDRRVPMMQVYELYAGRATPADVLAAAGDSASGLFYAHLYLGLYHEAQGELESARAHIELAATRHAQPHYMGEVARVHATLLTD